MRRFSSVSRLGFRLIVLRLFSMFLACEAGLWNRSLASFMAKSLISFLKVFQRSCGFKMSWLVFSLFRASRSSSSFLPCFMSLSITFLSLVRDMGHVHRPFPMSGASLGVNLIVTIQWLVGTGVGQIFQSYMCWVSLFAMYIRSSRDCICPPVALAR